MSIFPKKVEYPFNRNLTMFWSLLSAHRHVPAFFFWLQGQKIYND